MIPDESAIQNMDYYCLLRISLIFSLFDRVRMDMQN